MKCDIFNIWEDYRDGLKGYIIKRVHDENDAEDILQSVLIKVTNHCEKKNNVKHVKAWMYKVTNNTIIDFYKQSSRTINTDLAQLYLHHSQRYDESVFFWLDVFIDNLPVKFSLPLRLSDIEGKSQKEIAQQLGLTLAATKSRIQRARKKLREKFDKCGSVEQSENQTLSYTITKSCCFA